MSSLAYSTIPQRICLTLGKRYHAVICDYINKLCEHALCYFTLTMEKLLYENVIRDSAKDLT